MGRVAVNVLFVVHSFIHAAYVLFGIDSSNLEIKVRTVERVIKPIIV